MKLTRRRFLACFATTALSGSVAGSPLTSQRFYALGAEAQITLAGGRRQSQAALKTCRKEITAIESAFSLYDPNSMLSQLNRDGYVDTDNRFSTLLRNALHMAEKTGGAFDPTIQPLWQAISIGDDLEQARRLVGWQDLMIKKSTVHFAQPGMAASLNGIAQGFAADRISAILKKYGFHNTLVNIGEFAAQGNKHGRPWLLGITDPSSGNIVAHIEPIDAAIATSEPHGTLIGGQAHIFDPLERAGKRWTSVTVEAREAWRADALSTAIAASPVEDAQDLLVAGNATRAWLIDDSGKLKRV